MSVGVVRQDAIADEVLDERDRLGRRRMIGIDDSPWPEGSIEGCAVADLGSANVSKETLTAKLWRLGTQLPTEP